MLNYNNIEIRNLVEQVQYLSDFHTENQALASWGIRIIGQLSDAALLPSEGDFQYGDAYAVGTEAPFDFYIWTRTSAVGQPDYWFPFGKISIVGPQGPQGIQGPEGNPGPSTQWFTGTSLPSLITIENLKENDMYLQTNTGAVYQYKDSVWVFIANIKGPQGVQGIQGIPGEVGPQGPQGQKGDTGDVGGFINIAGILANTDQLPTPASLGNLTVAYLIGASAPYSLYIQVGSTSDTATWNDAGPFNAATLVMVEGQAQNVWDADTKLDKVENPSFATNITGAVYGVPNEDNPYPVTVDENGMIPVTYGAIGNTIASRTRQGFIYGNSSQGEGVLLADQEFYNYARDPYWLPNGATSGTIDGSIVGTLIAGSNKVIILDGEMYRQVYKDNPNINTPPTTIIYQHIDDNAIKTITIDITQNPRPWTLTVEEKPHIYSHYIAWTFSIAGDGAGYVIMNLITNDPNAYTNQTLYNYIKTNLSGGDIVSSGRYIFSSGSTDACAVSSTFYDPANDVMRVSFINPNGLVGKTIYGTGVSGVTISIKDVVVQLS